MLIRRLVLPLLLLSLAVLPLAAQVAPDAEWRSFSTEHFRVTFQEGLEPMARRAAERAEHAHRLLSRELVRAPRGQIDLVVANNVDFANGYATPFPTNRIVVYAHPPVDEPSLAFSFDWVELVVLHELAHIFHLDHAAGIWRPLRSVFGRSPILFPQVYSPRWLVEGLATYYESALTPAGRVRGTAHEMALRAAVLEDSFFPVDRATGEPARWPAGATPYIYGSLFVDFLARRHGPEAIPEFVEAVGRGLVPYRMDAAARRAFGTSFSRAWQVWADTLEAHYLPLADSLRALGVTEPEILTGAGRSAFHPRFAPRGGTIAYAASTGREEPALRLLLPDGSEREVVERTTLGPAAWTPDGEGLLFSQLDFVDPYRVFADLYRVEGGGERERLTRAARFWEPDLHPDGRRVVGVTDAGGSNAIEVRELATGEARRLTEPSPGVAWSMPRWSPDGERIAVGRWLAGGEYDVVILDAAGAVIRQATSDRAVDLAPTWSPDGRYVLFSSDRTGIPDLYAYDTRENRLLRVTRVLTGAFQPSVSPDGRWIAFAYYRADGYHIARIPYDPGSWGPAPPVRAEAAPLDSLPDLRASAGGEARPYSPWRSLAPATWSVALDAGTELGAGFGAAIGGRDLVERHLWGAAALVYPDGGRIAGGAAYRYRGWGNPVLDVALGQDWSVFRESGALPPGGGDPLPSAILGREREASASLSWLRSRWRSSAWLEVGGEARDLDRMWDEPELAGGAAAPADFPLDLGAVVEAGYTSARGTVLSLGPQEGFRVAGTLEGHRYAEPFAGEAEARGYLRLTGRGRTYHHLPLPGFSRHVAALRLDVGVETGSVSPGFGVGGASGEGAPVPLDVDLGGGLTFPVRGYPTGLQEGTRAFSASAEYRFPLLLVERGFRVLPVFLDRVWGDLFVDAGAAWCPGECERGFRTARREPYPLASVGAELNVETSVGYILDLPFRFGVAFPLRSPGAGRPEFHLRIGRSF